MVKQRRLTRKLRKLQKLPASHETRSFDPDEAAKLGSSLKLNYQGDLFGTRGDYSEAVLYMSRMPATIAIEAQVNEAPSAVDDRRHAIRVKKSDSICRKIARTRQCAASIEAMSANELLHRNLLKDGVTQSIFALCASCDQHTVRSCTAALCHLASGQSGAGREVLLRNGCVVVLSSVLKNFSDETITYNCLATIANLTIEDGFESILVKEKTMQILQKYNDHSEKAEYFCAMALFNMTCSSYSYAKIEEVIETIVRLTIKQSNKHFDLMSKALFNLSSNKMNQDKVREQDALSVLNSLSSSADQVVRTNAIQSFFCLSNNTSCRHQLAICGCVESLISVLSKTSCREELQYALLTLKNLSWEVDAAIRMGYGGIFDEIEKITRDGENSTHFGCIYAILANLLRIPWNNQYITETLLDFIMYSTYTNLDAVNVLVVVARLTSDDKAVVDDHECINEIANKYPELEWVRTPRMGSLVQDPKYLGRFISFATEQTYELDSSKDYLQAVILHNICHSHPAHALYQSFFPRIQRIADENARIDIKDLGVRAMAELCSEPSLHNTMMDWGVVETLVSFLDTTESSERIVCICLEIVCCLFDGQAIAEYAFIVQQIFPILVRLCPRSNSAIRTRCSACFLRFLVVDECRPDMVQNGLISSLALLTGDNDPNTLLQCVNTYSRLSCDADICQELIQNGIVKSLTTLSAAPEEFVRRACAIAFCNLSYSEENMGALVSKGTLPALLVIACVKSNDRDTRQLCMKAVINLMRDEANLSQMCQEGLPWAFAVFAENVNEDDAHLVASAFCRLAYAPSSRQDISRSTVINSFIKMLASDSSSPSTALSILKGMLNLLEESNRARASKLLFQSRVISICDDLLSRQKVADLDLYIVQLVGVLYHAACDYSIRHDQLGAIQNILAVQLRSPSSSEEVKYSCAIAIHRMSLTIGSASELINENRLLKIAIGEINRRNSDRVVSLLMRIMYNISCVYEHIEAVAEMGVVDAISFIVNSRPADVESLNMCSAIVRNLTAHEACHHLLVDDGGISLLNRLFQARERACKEDAAIASCNIILGSINSKRVLEEGGLTPVLWLMIHHDVEYLRLATAALRRLATPKGNVEYILNSEAIPVVAALLDSTNDMYVIENCIAVLCLFSSRAEARPILATYGAIALTLEKIDQHDDVDALSSSFRQICSDLLSNLASVVRPDAEAEKHVASTLIKLSQSSTIDQDKDWDQDREYLRRDGENAVLPEAMVSEERKLSVADSPTIALLQYPVSFDGYRTDFAANMTSVERHALGRVSPDTHVLRETINSSNEAPMVDFVKSKVTFGKSHRWRKLANVEFANGKLYPKITDTNPPATTTGTTPVGSAVLPP